MVFCERVVTNCASITVLERGAKKRPLERPEQMFGLRLGPGGVEAAVVIEDEFEGVTGVCERANRRLARMSAQSVNRAVVYQVGDDDSEAALLARVNLFEVALTWLGQSATGGALRIIVPTLSESTVRDDVLTVVGPLTSIAARSVDISTFWRAPLGA